MRDVAGPTAWQELRGPVKGGIAYATLEPQPARELLWTAKGAP